LNSIALNYCVHFVVFLLAR